MYEIKKIRNEINVEGSTRPTSHVAASESRYGQWSRLWLLSERTIVTFPWAIGMQPTAQQQPTCRNNRLCLQADNIWRLVCCLTAFWMRVTMYLPLGSDSRDMTSMTDLLSRQEGLASWPQNVVTWGHRGFKVTGYSELSCLFVYFCFVRLFGIVSL